MDEVAVLHLLSSTFNCCRGVSAADLWECAVVVLSVVWCFDRMYQ